MSHAMKKFLKYLIWSLFSLVGVFFGVVLLFAFVIPNPLGVTDRSTIFAANEFGIKEGFKVRDYINSYNKCPEELAGWSSNSRRSEFQYEASIPTYGKPGRTISIWYSCKENLDFVIWVRHSIDSDISVTGGKSNTIKIRYGHFTEPKELLMDGSTYKDVRHKLVESKLITSLGGGQ